MSPEGQDQLIDDFIACFGKFDEMHEHRESHPIAWELRTGDPDEYGRYPWLPSKSNTDASELQPLYGKLPGRFPVLYEKLVLAYRWAEVDLGRYRLLPNPPGPSLTGLLEQMSRANTIWAALIKSSYVQFGWGPDMDHDPVCFDLKSRKKNNRECRIVKIDHEEILCNNRVKVISELAPSFEKLLRDTIEQAKQR